MSESNERSLIEFSAPAKWAGLKDAIKAACAGMTGIDVRIEDLGDTLLVKRFEGDWCPKMLEVGFDPQRCAIVWRCRDPHANAGEITLRVFRESVFYVANGVNRPLDEIVFVLTSCVTGR